MIRYSPDNLPPIFELSPEDEAMCDAALERLRAARATMWRGSLPHLAGVMGTEHASFKRATFLYAVAAGGVA